MRKEMVAMILAGGQGQRLKLLTKKIAKPVVAFGGKYRIIDFVLSNCHNSGIDTVGVLTQYKPLALHSYIGTGTAWDLDRKNGGVYGLPPHATEEGGEWYKGTADAIYQNLEFLDMFNPEYVMVLSGDHIYKMDYSWMLKAHKEKKADTTIAVIEVPWEEASRFGIMATNEEGRITEFAEKPKEPKSNLASMGVYIFTWENLRKYLLNDAKMETDHDFGKNIIPAMLNDGKNLLAYKFEGYWKDVGTVDSLWAANMDLLVDRPAFNLYDPDWRMYSVNPTRPPHYVGENGVVDRAMISEGCQILGRVENSVIFPGVRIEEGAIVKDSVLMSHVQVGAGTVIQKAIVAQKTVIGNKVSIGVEAPEGPLQNDGIVLIGDFVEVPDNTVICADALVGREDEHHLEVDDMY